MAYTDIEFLAKIKPKVIEDMRQTVILASLTASQAFIESNKGNSGLTTKANNLFGMKGTYNGQYILMKTKEYYNGQYVTVDAKFRKYPSWADSIADHSGLFNRLARYSNLRGLTDYKLACKYVKDDGYATSPTYTQTLLNVIEKYRLYEWDAIALSSGDCYDEILPDLKPQPQPLPKPVLKRGSRNEYVRAWQIFLNLNGYDCGRAGADGIFGKATEKAVKQWQRDHGLVADGIIGPKTWASLPMLQ